MKEEAHLASLRTRLIDLAQRIHAGGDSEAEALGAELAGAVLVYLGVLDGADGKKDTACTMEP